MAKGSPLKMLLAAAMTLALVLSAQSLLPALATGHSLGPTYDTFVRAVSPSIPGLKATVDQGRGELVLTNRSDATVTVYGYEREPYLRLLPDGRVLENYNSPAKWVNRDQFANAPVPKFASAKAAPDWRPVASDSSYQWHDHRIHWMSPTPPRAVAGSDERTKIFDWKVPVSVADQPGAVAGSLFWQGSSKASPLASILVFSISGLVVIVGGIVWYRRSRETDAAPPGAIAEEKQAW